MDSLYMLSRAQFHQLCTHVSLYHEDASTGYRSLAEQCLMACKINPLKYTIWNVPGMSSYLGKAIPLDIHNRYVLVDEEKVLAEAKSYGVLRYAYLSAAVRAKEGGRWRYDFTTMNISIGIGIATGGWLLSFGRKRFGWMRRRPFGAVLASFGTCVFSTLVIRQAVRLLGVGVVMAENSHKSALSKLKCVDCLDDVNTYTANQVEEMKHQKIPQQPGMPPPPPEYVRQFEKAIGLQVKLLETDMEEVRLIKKHSHSQMCTFHDCLRKDADGYTDPNGLPVLENDRSRAKERAAAAAAAAAATSTTSESS